MSSLGHLPDGPWRFDKTVTDVFDDMLERSIPQYETMRSLVTSLAARLLPAHGVCVDLGCSRGESIARLLEERPFAHYVGLDASAPMVEAAQERFVDQENVTIESADLREPLPILGCDVSLLVLTLQFVPVEHRLRLLAEVCEKTSVALLLVEKVIGSGAAVDKLLVDTYHAKKRASGYTDEEVERKRLALEGVLVPLSASFNEHMVRSAGFREVDCVWRWANFAGWIALK